MARIQHDHIQGRDDFFRVLADVLPTVQSMEKQAPSYPVYALMARQLEAMQSWTANGRQPTREERRRINLGRVVSRELEPADAADQLLADKLTELSFYFKHWLDDDAWQELDDENLATFFPDDPNLAGGD